MLNSLTLLRGAFILLAMAFIVGGAGPGLARANMLEPEDTTLVLGFFPLGASSKNPWTNYKSWIERLIPLLDCRVVLYTTDTLESFFTELYLDPSRVSPGVQLKNRSISHLRRKDDYYQCVKRNGCASTSMVLITCYSHPYELPPIKSCIQEFETIQFDIDPEKSIHKPPLYATWLSKVWMVKQATHLFKDVPELVFWQDIGNLRGSVDGLTRYPDNERMSQLVGGKGSPLLENKIVHLMGAKPDPFLPKYKEIMTNEPMKERSVFGWMQHRADCLLGSIFGGKPSAVLWYEKAFYSKLAEWRLFGEFYGKEQDIFDAVAFQNPEKVLVLDGTLIGNVMERYYRYIYNYFGNKETQKFCSNPAAIKQGFLPFSSFMGKPSTVSGATNTRSGDVNS